MEALKQDITSVREEANELVKSEIQLIKLEFIDGLSTYAASVFSRFLIVIMLIASYMVGLMALGSYLNKVTHSEWIGHSLSAAIGVVLALLFFLFRKALLERPIQNQLIRELIQRMKP